MKNSIRALSFISFTVFFATNSRADLTKLRSALAVGALTYENGFSKIEPLKFDVNDVSFLFPPLTKEEIQANASDGTQFNLPRVFENEIVSEQSEQMIPSQFFDYIVHFSGIAGDSSGAPQLNPATGREEQIAGESDSFKNAKRNRNYFLNSLYVTALRFDDCGPTSRGSERDSSAHRKAKTITGWTVDWQAAKPLVPLLTPAANVCVPELRLIVQPLPDDRDTAIHLIFSFVENPEQHADGIFSGDLKPDFQIAQAIVSDLNFMKAMNSTTQTDGKPLAVHPALGTIQVPSFSNEALSFRQRIKKFVNHYARKEFLTTVAVLSTNHFDGNDEWVFFSLDGQAQSTPQVTPILALHGTPLSVGFSAKSTLAVSQNSTQQLFGDSSNPNLLDAIAFHLNPRRSGSLNTDCLSCHTETKETKKQFFNSSAGAHQIQRVFKKLFTDQEAESNLKFWTKGITGVAGAFEMAQLDDFNHLNSDKTVSRGGVNFRSFGWFLGTPTVSQRVSHESSLVAAGINESRFGKPDGPGWDCGAAIYKVALCQMKKRVNDSSPWDSCFKEQAACQVLGQN